MPFSACEPQLPVQHRAAQARRCCAQLASLPVAVVVMLVGWDSTSLVLSYPTKGLVFIVGWLFSVPSGSLVFLSALRA